MKKIVQINSVKNGSTGHIMNDLARKGRKRGLTVYTSCAGNLYQRRLLTEYPQFHLYIGGVLENKLHKILGTIFGCGGCFSQLGTFIYLKKLDRIKPDLIHLHNLHSNYINLKMLFSYIKKNKIPIVWTLHDCWAFTGHCPYFEAILCNKWKEQCYQCPQYKAYPKALRDDASFMYKRKKKLFTGLNNVRLVTPSKWLSGLVEQSFLKQYPVSVINNGIDLEKFQFTPSDFRRKYNLEEKTIVIGVSFSWGYRKGLDVFIQLARRLSDSYQIVLVGITDMERKKLPDNILAIGFTNSVRELIQIYSAADVFVNPTREDNFPTTHLEALACMLPIVTFRTGGAVESVDESCGMVVEQEDIDGLIDAIEQTTKNCMKEACRKKAQQFEIENKIEEYLEIYEELI